MSHENTRELVMSFLHYNGKNNKVFSAAEQQEIRKLGDGFGKGITDLDLVWDWSHIRDSSPEAMEAMAAKIRRLVG